jgi:hypothetical protein
VGVHAPAFARENKPQARGLVVPLTPEQVVKRALYLAGEVGADELDEYVRDPAPVCPTIYYRLNGAHDGLGNYNGGKDPTAPDPADRWCKPGSTFVNVTSDCVGGAAWCSGFDRYQPVRFGHLYSGWINTNSMILDASQDKRCFVPLDRPEPGCLIVCKSGSPGHAVGHVGVVVDAPDEWDPSLRLCWESIGVVDVASRQGRANRRTTGRGWYNTGALFLRSIMR